MRRREEDAGMWRNLKECAHSRDSVCRIRICGSFRCTEEVKFCRNCATFVTIPPPPPKKTTKEPLSSI